MLISNPIVLVNTSLNKLSGASSVIVTIPVPVFKSDIYAFLIISESRKWLVIPSTSLSLSIEVTLSFILSIYSFLIGLFGFRHPIQSGILIFTSLTGNSYSDSLSTSYISFSLIFSIDIERTGTLYSSFKLFLSSIVSLLFGLDELSITINGLPILLSSSITRLSAST